MGGYDDDFDCDVNDGQSRFVAVKSDVHTLSTLGADDDNADEDENISIPPTHAIEESEDEENEDEQNRGRHP